MKKAGMILAIAGGAIGLFSAIWVLFFGGYERSLAANIGREVTLGWQRLLFLSVYVLTPSILGIVGGFIANSRTAVAGALCLIGGVLGLPYFYTSLLYANPFSGYIVASPLLIIAGILLLISSRQAEPKPNESDGSSIN
jgi:hypothetical protein